MRRLRSRLLVGTIVVATSTFTSVQPAFAPSGPDTGCATKAEFRAEARHVMHQPAPQGGHKLRALIRCAPKAARRYLNRWHRWRRRHKTLLAARRYAARWRIVYRRLPSGGKQWAAATGACESGNNPRTATGNGFYGAFQWVPSTWYAAGGDRFPTLASWHHQAVLAWRWHLGHPSGQWPVCGE